MNRKDRRANKVKSLRYTLRDVATALCIAAPECVRRRWGKDFAHSAELSLAGREVLRRHQFAAELVPCVLVVSDGKTTLCVGDRRAGHTLMARRTAGKVGPYEQWEKESLFGGDADGRHTVVRGRDGDSRALVDLTFGQVAIKTKGAIQAPPAFVGLGSMDWHSVTMGDVWFQYAPVTDSSAPRELEAQDWSPLADDLFGLVGIALSCRNDEQAFASEMTRRALGR